MLIDASLQEKAILKEISGRVKQCRIASRLTQEELAEQSMVSISTIRRFESGYDISFSKLIHLLKALGLEKNLELLVPDYEKRPSYHLAHEKMPKRVKKSVKKKADWKWGDEA